MKVAMIGLAALVLLAAPMGALEAAAQGGARETVEPDTRGVFTEILRILVKWLFPIGAAYCFLYGIIGKGVKRGEWDMAAICTVAAIALALFPKLLSSLFGVELKL